MDERNGTAWVEYRVIPLERVVEISNIRENYDERLLQELAQSIQTHGQLEPILVYEEGDRYGIITGHRRVRAMRLLEKGEINAVVRPKPGKVENIYIQANENEQAKTLSGPERERYVKTLLDYGEKRASICEKLCMKRSWMSRIVGAYEFRQRHGEQFERAGVELDTDGSAVLPVKVTQRLTVDRKKQTITLEYACDEGVEVVEELSGAIRKWVEEWFRSA